MERAAVRGEQAMDALQSFLNTASGFVWGPFLLIPLLLGTGLFLSVLLKFMPLLRIGTGFRMALDGRQAKDGDGEITPFQALTTALAATIGTGNIAGVATAIFLGGPGAVFWMWITALLGMATKYSEAVLAVRFREVSPDGRYVGGPMYYIRNGLGKGWAWLGAAFAFFAMIAGFGIGNMVQANSVADAMEANFGVPHIASGIALSALTFAVIIGGLQRIALVAERLVPLMALAYIAGALIILILNAPGVPGAFALIITDAFTGTAAAGGFAGAAVWAALRFGVARGIFSNESGLGSASIAHAAARTEDPVRQGTIAMMGTFIDTIIVCTMTALVILTVQVPFATTSLTPASDQGADARVLTATADPDTSGALFEAETGTLSGSDEADDFVRVTDGAQTITTGTGADTIVGFPSQFSGDRITDFGPGDTIRFLDAGFGADDIQVIERDGDTVMVRLPGEMDDGTPILFLVSGPGVAQGLGVEQGQEMVGAWSTGRTGAELSTYAFGSGLPGAQWVISLGLIVFAFTTVLGWSVYGERSAEYLFGPRIIQPYRMAWVLALLLGASVELSLVWTFSDVMNGLMAIPNLIALLLLSGLIVRITKEALDKEQ